MEAVSLFLEQSNGQYAPYIVPRLLLYVKALETLPNPAEDGGAKDVLREKEFDVLGQFGALVYQRVLTFASAVRLDEMPDDAAGSNERDEHTDEPSPFTGVMEWREKVASLLLSFVAIAKQCHAHLVATFAVLRGIALADCAPPFRSDGEVLVCTSFS